jgi:hypothetical protein
MHNLTTGLAGLIIVAALTACSTQLASPSTQPPPATVAQAPSATDSQPPAATDTLSPTDTPIPAATDTQAPTYTVLELP